MKYRAYAYFYDARGREVIPELEYAPYNDGWIGYTDGPYGQPARFHEGIALLDAAADDKKIDNELAGVGHRYVYVFDDKTITHTDYFILDSFLERDKELVNNSGG